MNRKGMNVSIKILAKIDFELEVMETWIKLYSKDHDWFLLWMRTHDNKNVWYLDAKDHIQKLRSLFDSLIDEKKKAHIEGLKEQTQP